MDNALFQDLLASVQDMGRHKRGEALEGVRTSQWDEPDVKALREGAGVSQTEFARLIGVSRRTLENWVSSDTRNCPPGDIQN